MPMHGMWATGTDPPTGGPSRSKPVINPAHGVRDLYGSFNVAGVGSPRLVTGGVGRMITLGDGTKNPTMNSSTTKGAKALARKRFRRRCRTAIERPLPVDN